MKKINLISVKPPQLSSAGSIIRAGYGSGKELELGPLYSYL